jgi:hypothetical protein
MEEENYMRITVAGGTGNGIALLKDLKLRIAFNSFDGDGVLAALFPKSITKNTEGKYEIVGSLDGSGSSDIAKVISKVSVESDELNYVAIGLGVLALFVGWLIFKK